MVLLCREDSMWYQRQKLIHGPLRYGNKSYKGTRDKIDSWIKARWWCLGRCSHVQEPDLVGEDMLSSSQVNNFLPQPRNIALRLQLLLRLSKPPCSSGSRSMVTGRWGFGIPSRDCPLPPNPITKGRMLVGVLVMVGFAVGKAPVPEVRTCHLCLLEDPSTGCISGSEKCTISTPSPCMVITIYYDTKIRFFIRGCGQYNSYRCQEKRNTYFSEYWYQAQCCQYDYCNSWSSPQLHSSPPDPPAGAGAGAVPLSESQIQWFYQALNLSLPLHSFHAGKEPEGPNPPAILPLNLSLSIADLRRIYLFLNSSGLLVLPWARP